MPFFNAPPLLPSRLSDHYRLIREVRAGNKADLYKILSLTSLTVFFEAWGIAMVLPIIGFLRSDSDPARFAEESKFGKYVVETFSFVGLPLNLLTLCFIVITMITVRQALNYVYTLHVSHLKLRVGRDLSLRCFVGILGSKAENIGHYRAGQFALLLQQECQAAASMVRCYSRIWSLLLTFVIYFSIMLIISPLASVGAMVLIGGMLVALGGFTKVTRHLAARRIRVRADLVSFFEERFRGWLLIKTGNALDFERENARKFIQRDFDTEFSVSRIGGLAQMILTPTVMFIALFSTYFAIEYFHMEVDKVAMFMFILLRLVPTGQAFSGQRHLINSYDPSLRLIAKTLEQARAATENLKVGEKLPALTKGIAFEDVSFTYPGEETQVLQNINFAIPAGKMTAIIGHSGAGKTTVIDLVNRLYSPTQGRVLYDGVPVDKFNLNAYRDHIISVTQETTLFNDSIAEGIKYFNRTASTEEIETAARLAHADEFIRGFPEGFDTSVGENGSRLSGGEKQRVALARIFLSKAEIIILDEPTSALDLGSEAKIRDTLEQLINMKDRTVIVIAHRLSTIKNADFIIHLSGGELVDFGPPEKILGKGSIALEEIEFN